jgi:UDP-N-acetylmuramate--alanine ligase
MGTNLQKTNTSEILNAKKIFFIGIGGIGISALAKMAQSKGMEVSGVNDEEGKTVDSLREFGIEVMSRLNLDMVQICEGPSFTEADAYIYSDAWLNRGPEIIEAAKKTGKPVVNYAQALGIFSKDYKTIAISGTHGKTTTTAMVADILIEAGFDPTVIVGSFVKKFNSNFRAGKSEYLIVEADEYNRHMLELYPYIGAITNIEADHLDCYQDLNDIKSAFEKFVQQSEKSVVEYFEYLDQVPELSVPGKHNRENAACALAIANLLKIDLEIAQKALTNFSGTWRRLEKRGMTETGMIIYDDYAHHPSEVKASLQALRELYSQEAGWKLTVVFQPHLYSRTKALFDDFVKCFTGADQIILLPIYFAREDPDPTISSGKLAEAICQHGEKAIAFTDFDLAEEYLKGRSFRDKDVFVTMGAGEAYKVADNLFKF